MTITDFIDKIKGRYPRIQEDPFTIKDLEDGLKSFSLPNREKLFQAFIDTYTLGRSPRWADFNNIAIASGIIRSKPNPLKYAFNICSVCNTAYSSEGRVCPTCHKMTPYNVSAGKRPDNFMRVRHDCGQCKLYTGNDTDGVLCPDFGTYKTYTMPMCKACTCHRCCYETHAISEGLAGDTTLFDKLTNKNKWETRIREDCKTI